MKIILSFLGPILQRIFISVRSKIATHRQKRKAIKLDIKNAKKAAKAQVKTEKSNRKHTHKIDEILASNDAIKSKVLLKAQKEKNKHELLLAQEKTAAIKAGKILNPTRISRYLTVIKLLAPLLMPIIYRLSTKTQTYINEKKAQTSGIPLIELGKYSGTGGKLAARIEASRISLSRIQKTNSANLEVKTFVSTNTKKLEDLANAVNTAERLPRTRRNNAQLAIDEQLTIIEKDLLTQLGVYTS